MKFSMLFFALIAFDTGISGCGKSDRDTSVQDGSSSSPRMPGMDHSSHDAGSGSSTMADMPGMSHAAQIEESAAAKSPSSKVSLMPGMEGISQLSNEDQAVAVRQHMCPVTDEMLGSIGKPIKVTVKEQEVWLCCDSCKKKLLANPDEYLAKLHGDHGSMKHISDHKGKRSQRDRHRSQRDRHEMLVLR
jgi:hypothetical protein